MKQSISISLQEETIQKIKSSLLSLAKYKGNPNYKKRLTADLQSLNKSHRFLKAKIAKLNNQKLSEKFNFANSAIEVILSDADNSLKLKSISDLENFWPELEVELEDLHLNVRSFDVPEEIPVTENRLDLEEAIKDFDNDCFISALVLCRRAYEGALAEVYKSKTGKEPIEDMKCNHCKNTVRANSYMGIAKLHNWAIENKIVTERLKQAGSLIPEVGAGAAHPPLKQFPRDKEIARLGITAALALLKEIYTNK